MKWTQCLPRKATQRFVEAERRGKRGGGKNATGRLAFSGEEFREKASPFFKGLRMKERKPQLLFLMGVTQVLAHAITCVGNEMKPRLVRAPSRPMHQLQAFNRALRQARDIVAQVKIQRRVLPLNLLRVLMAIYEMDTDSSRARAGHFPVGELCIYLLDAHGDPDAWQLTAGQEQAVVTLGQNSCQVGRSYGEGGAKYEEWRAGVMIAWCLDVAPMPLPLTPEASDLSLRNATHTIHQRIHRHRQQPEPGGAAALAILEMVLEKLQSERSQLAREAW